jgi:hypothetical protein
VNLILKFRFFKKKNTPILYLALAGNMLHIAQNATLNVWKSLNESHGRIINLPCRYIASLVVVRVQDVVDENY